MIPLCVSNLVENLHYYISNPYNYDNIHQSWHILKNLIGRIRQMNILQPPQRGCMSWWSDFMIRPWRILYYSLFFGGFILFCYDSAQVRYILCRRNTQGMKLVNTSLNTCYVVYNSDPHYLGYQLGIRILELNRTTWVTKFSLLEFWCCCIFRV